MNLRNTRNQTVSGRRWLEYITAFLVLLLCNLIPTLAAVDLVPLAGEWHFQLDPDDAGLGKRWFSGPLPNRIKLPGTLAEQGVGNDISLDTSWTGEIVDRSWFTDPKYAPYRRPGNIKVPFWLQPDKHYVGPAWFQRDINVPAEWKNRRVLLVLERPHWETQVWLDTRRIGSDDSLSTPHEYLLGTSISPGAHRLTIRVDNRLIIDVGVNSHSISDHTQGNWNGIVGRLELMAEDLVWIDDLEVYPHVGTKSITVKGRIGNCSGRSGKGIVTLAVRPLNPNGAAAVESLEKQSVPVSWNAVQGAEFSCQYPLGREALLWDEFNPYLYQLTALLNQGRSTKSVTFGLREISARKTQLLLNGRKLYLRGTLECAIFPKSGHPPVDVASWKRIIAVARAHGLNHFRFHSWCPPEAAFNAADELGFYLQVECGSWANQSTSLGDGKPVDQWIYRETERILESYGNHPSFLFLAYGNEPGGRHHADYLAKWLAHWKTIDDRRLYTGGSGWPEIRENEFHITPKPRIQAWGQGLDSRINSLAPETWTDYRDFVGSRTVPVISHEIGQWCVYPNFDEIQKYTGYLKPKNFEIFRDLLHSRQMGDLARPFLKASGKLQALCYKEEIESALRTPGMGGFQLLDLHDFPGQGTALVGVLDPFWEPKGYITAEEFNRFCGSTVPLGRMRKRVFTDAETFEAELEVAHFGPAPLREARPTWKIINEKGSVEARGAQPILTVPVGNGIRLGRLNVNLSRFRAPQRYKLVVRLTGKLSESAIGSIERTFENDWDFWVYPSAVDVAPPSGVLIVDNLDQSARSVLENGGRVLLFISPKKGKADQPGRVALGFSSIFWNTAWTRDQPPHTLGILCDPKHPALAAFPTEFHSNWQWWYIVTRAGAMIMDELPAGLRPIVHVIDDWVTAHRLGLLFEARLFSGKLLVCSIDLRQEIDQNPVARQMLHSLFLYMDSDQFSPAERLTAKQIESLLAASTD